MLDTFSSLASTLIQHPRDVCPPQRVLHAIFLALPENFFFIVFFLFKYQHFFIMDSTNQDQSTTSHSQRSFQFGPIDLQMFDANATVVGAPDQASNEASRAPFRAPGEASSRPLLVPLASFPRTNLVPSSSFPSGSFPFPPLGPPPMGPATMGPPPIDPLPMGPALMGPTPMGLPLVGSPPIIGPPEIGTLPVGFGPPPTSYRSTTFFILPSASTWLR